MKICSEEYKVVFKSFTFTDLYYSSNRDIQAINKSSFTKTEDKLSLSALTTTL